MPEFISQLVFFGRHAGHLYGAVDSLLNRELYYKNDRDVVLINTARAIFARVFGSDQPFPSEFLYAHETPNDKAISAQPVAPEDGYYRPPYQLPKQYSIRQVESDFSENLIWNDCRNAVIALQTYLNQLNKDAESPLNTKLNIYHYGHHSDSVRFLCFLIMNAFVGLSKMDLNRKIALEEADRYIQFLLELKHHPLIFKVLESIHPTTRHDIDAIRKAELNEFIHFFLQRLCMF